MLFTWRRSFQRIYLDHILFRRIINLLYDVGEGTLPYIIYREGFPHYIIIYYDPQQ